MSIPPLRCIFPRVRTVIGVTGPDLDDAGADRQTFGHGRAVHAGVKDGRVVVHVQDVEVHSDRAGLPAAVLRLRCQDVVLLRLIVQRTCHVEHPRHGVQQEGLVLVILLQQVRDLSIHPGVGVAGQDRRHDGACQSDTEARSQVLAKWLLIQLQQFIIAVYEILRVSQSLK